ncbi:hypothetical protein T02_10639 [Trichinella nativa]|uniref:Uncharacterized protein n=1 Tax=Trichinella nativa TaxID=6335 RepID=A0A0V1L3M6_9BILA|nr:hypothetical protein T06_13174 [Trichinella sp. T6]KRZ54144.1 hypothetical protein T02_10639 [Trichinella nativa]
MLSGKANKFLFFHKAKSANKDISSWLLHHFSSKQISQFEFFLPVWIMEFQHIVLIEMDTI